MIVTRCYRILTYVRQHIIVALSILMAEFKQVEKQWGDCPTCPNGSYIPFVVLKPF